MMKSKFGKIAVSVVLAAVCACGITACGNQSSGGNVAAKVNDAVISEDAVTSYIQNLRAQIGYSDDETWAQYLSMIGMTPDQLRTNILDGMISEELIAQYASEKGVEVDPEEVERYIDLMKENFANESDWEAALEEAGMTEDGYRETIEKSLRNNALNAVFESEVEASEEELLAVAQNYASYIDGSRRSSHILFSLDDRELAQSVLDQIRAGELDFAEAAKQYSIDGSAENGGDVGWDAMSTFVIEYQSALDALEIGQVSELVESQFGYHIIMCTEHFVAPEQITSIDQIPEAFREVITNAAKSSAVDEVYSAWLEEVREKANIVINDMPEDVPYNVAMPQTEESGASEPAESANGETNSNQSA